MGKHVVAALAVFASNGAVGRIHPEVAARAVEAAGVVGLDVAGIDLLARDLGTPLEEQGGVISAVRSLS